MKKITVTMIFILCLALAGVSCYAAQAPSPDKAEAAIVYESQMGTVMFSGGDGQALSEAAASLGKDASILGNFDIRARKLSRKLSKQIAGTRVELSEDTETISVLFGGSGTVCCIMVRGSAENEKDLIKEAGELVAYAGSFQLFMLEKDLEASRLPIEDSKFFVPVTTDKTLRVLIGEDEKDYLDYDASVSMDTKKGDNIGTVTIRDRFGNEDSAGLIALSEPVEGASNIGFIIVAVALLMASEMYFKKKNRQTEKELLERKGYKPSDGPEA